MAVDYFICNGIDIEQLIKDKRDFIINDKLYMAIITFQNPCNRKEKRRTAHELFVKCIKKNI